MSSANEQTPEVNDTSTTTNETEQEPSEPMMDPAKIVDVLQNNDEAQNIMEKMFGTLMQSPELSAALMNPELMGMLGGLGKNEDGENGDGENGDAPDMMSLLSGLGGQDAEGGATDIMQVLSGLGGKDAEQGVEQGREPETIHTPDGLEDITSTIQESSAFPHEIERTITELEDTRNKGLELHVKFESDDIRALYDTDSAQYATDSGWDLRFAEDVTIPAGALSHKFDFGVSVCCYDKDFEGCALWLLPRSSIVKTPLRLANSMGLIDASYRGTLKAFVDNRNSDEPFTVKKGDRLFQIASPTLAPLTVKAVKELPKTDRGANGFGSTGA